MSGLGESDSGLGPQSHSKRFARFKRGRDRRIIVGVRASVWPTV